MDMMSKFLFLSAFILCFSALSTSIHGQDDDGFQQAKLLNAARVTVPKEAQESGLGGKVNVLVAIDETGSVSKVEQTSGPGYVCSSVTKPDVVAMRKAASDAATKATFSPAVRKGKPAKSSIWLTFDFPQKPRTDNQNFSALPVGGSSSGAVMTNSNVENRPTTIKGGVMNGRALKLPRPEYPPAAHAVRASGAVSIQVLILEDGSVFSAEPVSGHPLLRSAARGAACEAKFSRTTLSGEPVKVSGIITYNFVP
ncbi:MAG: energy transducer TonB [Pyrinomonadaceae bacterium]